MRTYILKLLKVKKWAILLQAGAVIQRHLAAMQALHRRVLEILDVHVLVGFPRLLQRWTCHQNQ